MAPGSDSYGSSSTQTLNQNKILFALIAFFACYCIYNHSITSTHTTANNPQDVSLLSSSYSSSGKRLGAPQSPQAHPVAEDPSLTSTATISTTTNIEWYEKPEPLLSDWPKLSRRLDAIPLLEKMRFKRGIEVGVQRGVLAKKTLMTWKSCEEYKLIDLWGKEDGYQEPGEHSTHEHNKYLRETRGRMKPWTEKGVTEFFIMRSTDAAKQLKNDYFDFIYLDARHDYCAVKEDMEHYYPKLRPGGIFGGHDYTDTQYAIDRLGEHEDWSKCEDGSIHPEGVKGAVDNFAKENKLYIVTSNEDFPSWYVQKPYQSMKK